MRIELYATSWNDARVLGYFFRHYDPIVDRYVIFDDGSTDGSLELLLDHPRVEVRPFERHDSNSFVLSEQYLSNQCWKESRGRADWVMVLDLDEHLLHATLSEYLHSCKDAGVTIVPAVGFQMMTQEFPAPNENLSWTRRRGAPWVQMCKCSLFDPNQIEEIDFNPGRHRVNPIGRVIAPRRDELLNLHYKYLGFDYVLSRHRELREGLGSVDEARNWGHKYGWSEEELRRDWQETEARLVDVTSDPQATAASYPLPRWWDKWRPN